MTAWLARAAQRRPEAPALIDDNTRLNFSALAEQAARRAAVLSGLGVHTGDRVMLEATLAADTVVWLHAVLWLGATVVPIAPGRPRDDTARLLGRFRPRAYIAQNIGPASGPADCVAVDAGSAIDPGAAPVEAAAHDPARIATIMLTSGSSAAPKAVPLTLGNHAASAAAIARRTGTDPADRWLLCLPLAHIGGLAIVLRSVLAGTAVVIMPRFDPGHFPSRIREQRITLASMVPGMLDSVMRNGDPPPLGLRALFIGGAPAAPQLLERARDAGWPVIPTWGMTEACSQLATPSPDAAAGMDFSGRPAAGLPPLPGVEVRSSASGALQVRGPMLFAGYLDGTAPGPDDLGWFTTGDRGVVDAAGDVRVTGRVDNVIISGGINVDLDAVAQRLLECPLVQDAATVGIADERWGQRVAAAVVVANDMAGNDEATGKLATWARRHLAPAERPLLWRVVEHIPRSAAGKPLAPALAALFESQAASRRRSPDDAG